MSRFVTYQGKKTTKWYWRFIADNGRIMADGAEGYDSQYNANRAVIRFVELASEADQPHQQPDPEQLELPLTPEDEVK